MAEGRKPDYRVTFPVTHSKGNGKDKEERTTWHRLGAGWKRDSGSIGIILDVGVPITLPPGAQLVLVENTDDENTEENPF